MTDTEPCYDLNGRRVTLIKDVAKGGKLAAILVVQEGGTVIRLDPRTSKLLALALVATNMEHDQSDPGGHRDEDIDGPIPGEDEDLMLDAFPWSPTMAQRARALELVDIRFHGGDWQTAFITAVRSAIREQDVPEMYWALTEYASQALAALGREEGSRRIQYDLECTLQAAAQERGTA